jgi:hypothetical protein
MNVTEANHTLDLIRALTGQHFEMHEAVNIACWLANRARSELGAGPHPSEVQAWVMASHPIVTPEPFHEDRDPDDDRDDLDEDDVRDVEDVVPTL